MKYVGLLSGGKDSCFNLLHCLHNGHELVAAATLGPGPGKDEIDSYMYQTVGQDLVDLIAQALDVPLYRRDIVGTAVELGNEYGGRTPHDATRTDGDETEDLFELLSTVKRHHPNIQGVAIGAILSNYQRVRMEHVCRRLDLTPLCYLWQRNQRELLGEMIDAGMECIIVKIAGIGLTVKHLGKTLAEMQPTLLKLNDMYDLHVCGEGGEYETMTLDCPLFKRRIQLQETQTIIHSDKSFATVAYLKFTSAILVDKEIRTPEVEVPALLDESLDSMSITARSSGARPIRHDVTTPGLPFTSHRQDRWISIANVSASDSSLTFEDEVRACFTRLKAELARYNLSSRNIASVDVTLSSIELFPRLNAIYAEEFRTSPPSRACVGVPLLPPARVSLGCIAYETADEQRERQALHVQGLSYWAPVNIGPYSQAIRVGNLVFVSGQIGLVPASLTIPQPPSLEMETALSFQHIHRVLAVVASRAIAIVSICWLTSWEQISVVQATFEHSYPPSRRPPVVFVGATSLPKEALVETHVTAHDGLQLVTDEDGYTEERAVEPQFEDSSSSMLHHVCYNVGALKSTLIAFNAADAAVAIDLFKPYKSSAQSARLFYSANISDSLHVPIAQLGAVNAIPVQFVATSNQHAWDFALSVVSGVQQ